MGIVDIDFRKEPCSSCEVPRTAVKSIAQLLELEAKCMGCRKRIRMEAGYGKEAHRKRKDAAPEH